MKLKLVLGVLVMVAASSMGAGCAPGLTSRAAAAPANGPEDVLRQMDAELANAIVGTTTLTSASLDLPDTRGSLAETRKAEAPAAPATPATPTWGVVPEAPRPIETQSPYAQ